MEEKKQIPEEIANAEMAELTDGELEKIVGGVDIKIGATGKTSNASKGRIKTLLPCEMCRKNIEQYINMCGRKYYHCKYCGFTRNNFDDVNVMGDTESDQIFWKSRHPGETPTLFEDQWIVTGRAQRI